MEQFNKISIRGRYAFGMKCMETALVKFNINDDLLNRVIQKAWEFTTTQALDDWEDELSDLTPDCLMEIDIEEVEDNALGLSKDELIRLKMTYEKLPQFILEIFHYTLWIGYEHLYSVVPNESPETLKYIKNIIRLMQQNNLPTPSIEKYLSLKFSEDSGWGKEISRSYFDD